MNQTQPYMDMHSSHLSSAQSYAPQGATAGTLPHYQHYQQHPVMQQGSATYAPASSTYPSYGYPPNGVTSPQSGSQPSSTAMNSQVPAQLLPLPPAMSTTAAGPPGYVPGPPGQPYSQHPMDTTGQVAPPGMKPRVTATLWEDEGSLCYQVEAKGVCVARREDNHMINGTKLLNVAGMTRGRRDGILKSEKIRHVVKIGPMHLKGVWIPFERALDFANKEKITEQLYPLFVHNIGGLLYHPTNQNRTNAIVAASERRRLEGSQAARTPQGSQPPTLHHHHSMHNPPTGPHMSQPPPHSIAPHPAAGRPGLDRAHTFPTPPTSASSIIGANQGSSYEWGGQNMGGNIPGTQPLSIDTGLTNTRSMPTTPATTPPGNNMQSMQQYQGQPGYDSSKSYYSQAPSSQAHYAPQQPIGQEQPGMARYGQPISTHPYMKNEMGPPTGRSSGSETQPSDTKADPYTNSQGNVQVGHGAGEGGAEHEQPEYINDNSAYNANRGSYTYTANPPVATIAGEHSHLSPEITGSPSHPNGSGRGTPRTSGHQTQWASGYHTPPRAPPSSNVFHVMSDTRGSGTNGAVPDAYSTSSAAPPTYPAPPMNGNSGSNKRGRDDDEHDQAPRPDAHETNVAGYEHKRRKTLSDASIGGPVRGAPMGVQAMAPGIVSRRR